MIVLWIIVGCALGGSTLGAVGMLVALVANGQLTLPGTKLNAVKRAEQEKTISFLEFERSQAIINRQVMEAKAEAELARIHDEGFQNQLNKGS